MLKFINKVREIEVALSSLAVDYRIEMRFNQVIRVFIKSDSILDLSALNLNQDYVIVEFITEQEVQESEYYRELFSSQSTQNGHRENLSANHIFGYTQTLRSITESNNFQPIDFSNYNIPPIVSFYSYKGGVGRTTTLMIFALHCAFRGKKVLVLDCDFEAPGFLNFWGLKEYIERNETNLYKGGLVEFLLNKQFDTQTNIQDYLIRLKDIKPDYCGEGEVYLMTAGDLRNSTVADTDLGSNLDTHLGHYLHGLARLDVSNPDAIAEQMRRLFIDAQAYCKFDMILIDSRTGFSEVFANLVLRFSRLIVAFISSNRQSAAGLHYFFKEQTLPTYVLIHPYNPNISTRPILQDFRRTVDEISRVPISNLYAVEYSPTLASYGYTGDADRELDMVDMARNNSYPDENEKSKIRSEEAAKLFDYIIEQITPIPIQTNIVSLAEQKREILNIVADFFERESSFGDMQPFRAEVFYFRDFMKEIFDRRKYIIRGSRGTGKTAFYTALLNPVFVKTLQEWSNQSSNFIFVDIISNPKLPAAPKLLYPFEHALNPQNLGLEYAVYYRRFWIIYTWNAIYLSNYEQNIFAKESVFGHLPNISNDTETALRFENWIRTENFRLIEQDLREIDILLGTTNTHLVVLYDYLDRLIKPIEWGISNNRITPLFLLWESNPYSNILPKIFVRSDLFRNAVGFNNKAAFEANISNVDWQKNEMFAYFFKIIAAKCQNQLFNYARQKFANNPILTHIEETEYLLASNQNQIPVTQTLVLQSMVSLFFGEWADVRNPTFGSSYDWFFKNLQDMKGVISLRPFIKMIGLAARTAFNRDNFDYPILSGVYYSYQGVRSEACAIHFGDLANEEGNEYLKNIVDFIREGRANEYRKSRLYANELEDLLQKIIAYYSQNDSQDLHREMTVPRAKNLLIDTGIIRQNYVNNSVPTYSFAFLYKYYLGLRS